jgi:glycosyltransferase involved in cell wall biosynthesis
MNTLPPPDLVTTILITYNEELHLARALDSARRYSSQIVVVDSYSTDATEQIARAGGARFLQNPWVNHAKQFNWALEHGGITTPWVLRLDADEIIGEDLAETILRDLPTMPADVSGVTFDRRHIFLGRWVRHGGRYPLRLLRLWRTGMGQVEDRWMDEHVVLSGGRTTHMAGRFEDANLKDITFFTAKHNDYATREAVEVLIQNHNLPVGRDAPPDHVMTRQAAIKRLIKKRIYNKLPFGAGPLGYFLYRYIVQLGFLDGRTGLIYHVLQGFWYRFLVNAKLVELDMMLSQCPTADDKIAALRAATGLKL